MAVYSKTEKVSVIIRKDANGRFYASNVADLDLDFDFGPNKKAIFKGGSAFILFEIDNKDGAQYYFASPEAAFSVEVEGSSSPSGEPLSFCEATAVGSKKGGGVKQTLLLVRNDNPSQQRLKYTLNLVSDSQDPRNLPIDPIMNNQNSGCALDGSTLIAPWAAAAFGLGLIGVTAAAVGLLRNSADD